jgi:hypothetical protein
MLATEVRLAFFDVTTLVIGDENGPGWALLRGQARPDPLPAIALDPSSVVLQAPRIMSCSPTGWLPVRTGQGWGWVPAACEGLDTCIARRPRFRPHRPTGVRLSLALEVASARRVATPATAALTTGASTKMLLVAVINFDPTRLRRDRRMLEGVRGQSRPRLRELPATDPGPLAAAERSALRRLLCERSTTSW